MSNSECSKDGKQSVENAAAPSGSAESVKDTKDNESRGQIVKIDESDEDIPGDFFDDFLKEDFMAGLDIVDDDEWDENKAKTDLEASAKSKNDTSLDKKQAESVKKRKKEKVSSKNSSASTKKSTPDEKRSRQKKKRNDDKKDDSKRKKTSDKQIDADEFDIRRDPEKTKRDIARDKVRCEKDKEMKIISEKLSLVETGLVPPGMEMEIDIEELKKQKEKIDSKDSRSPRDLREHIKDLKGRNKSPAHRPRSPVRRRSPIRRSPNLIKKLSPIRRRSRSPRKEPISLIRSALSPIRRSPRRSPIRSPIRRLSPRRLSPLRVRSPLRAYARRRSRSVSPYYKNRRDRRRDRSSSRESDRERWLKNRHRSRSPRRKRDEKKSFLQEIAEKLNEIRQPVNMMTQLQPMAPVQQMPPAQPMMQPMQPALRYVEPQSLPIPVPAPAPVPAPVSVPVFPNPLPQQQQKYDPYDQTFFIGDPQAVALSGFPGQPLPSPVPSGPQMPLIPSPVQPMNTSVMMRNSITPNSMNPPIPTSMAASTNLEQVLQNKQRQKVENQEDIGKLFQDKQISLSEFLAITAKPEVFSSSPTHLQEKIKVLTRCHDAIKILESCERKYSGKLVVHKTNKYKLNPGKYLSPLKSAPPVEFAFTNPVVSMEEQKNTFTNFIDSLLQKLGLLKDTVVNIDDEEPVKPVIAERQAVTKFSPPPPPLITPIKNPVPKEANNARFNKFYEINRLCKMVQTDVFKCESCEKRKKILYRSTAMQAGCPDSFSVSTQVTEEDFQPRISKTQSLAALTPAQLLAKSRESLNALSRGNRIENDNFDIHASGYNRPNFFRSPDSYGLSRPNPPFANTHLLMYDNLDSQMFEGGGRGRDPYASRTLEPNVRFSHNYY